MPEPLNAAQVSAMQEQLQKHLKTVIDAMGLRKYAVQAALDAKVPDPLPTAEKIYDFITQPAQEVIVRIEQ